MAQPHPETYDYLAVVSEWTSTTQHGSLVGNAYPLLNLTTGQVVDAPLEDFPNPGAVFLTSRTNLKTWDFVVIRPQMNRMYNNATYRQCYYIPARQPELLSNPSQTDNLAVVIDHPAFDLNAATRQLLNPQHNVTPVFFVRKHQTLVGPLLRNVTQLDPMEDVQRIDWQPLREDGIVFEFTPDELLSAGVQLLTYEHPDPQLNRVLDTPITLAVGPVRKATSRTPRDALAEAALIEWYVQRCPTVDLPTPLLTALKAAFRGRPGDDPFIQAARLRKIEPVLATHAAFLEQRERFAKQYVESEGGRQRTDALIEQTVARRASEIQGEVDRRQSELAAKREELSRQFEESQRQHQQRLEALDQERQAVQEQVRELQAAVDQLQQQLSADVRQLAGKMQQELPLFAALTVGRLEAGPPPAPAPNGPPPSPPACTLDLRPVPPTSVLRPVEDEARLLDDLHADIGRRGLSFTHAFIANVYTCLKAEPLNLVIGPPGYGKSMLIAALARGLGHADACLRIAVRRSWSEDRYLLGSYDSFHGRYDPGPTGLVPRMLQAAEDWRQQRSGVYLVLLDEFNLAAPEYYFSQLLLTLPSDDPVREIVLYDQSQAGADRFPARVALTPNLRFWGTINYDETTERLSPRALDRTGMIFLGDADVGPTLPAEEKPPAGVTAAELFGKFFRRADQCPEDRWELVAQVIDFLRRPEPSLGPRIELSPRVQKAIKRYLANSVKVLDLRPAVDFVVQQRILPVVRGRGEGFLARISGLAELLAKENLSRSAQHVTEALRRADQQFGDLDFLSY